MTELEQYARTLAEQAGLDPDFVAAIGRAESNWNPKALSPKGAMGAMQLMPATAKMLGVDPSDPMANVRGGVAYLKQLNDKYKDPQLVAAAYNAGPGAVDRAGGVPNFPETQAYVRKVTAIDPSKVQWDEAGIDASKVKWDEAPKNADSNLGGTLQLGIPFTGKRYDTGIPLPASLEAGIVGAGKTTQRLLQGVNPFTNKADVEEENRLYQPLKDAHPIATTAGEIAPYLAATSIPAMMAMSAAEYGTPMERAERAAFAGAGGLVGKGVGRLFGPKSMAPIASNGAEDFVDTALSAGNKWGIPLRMAQTTDSKPVQIVDAVAQNLPVVGNVINKAKDASYQGFNRAVSNTFGEDATKITPELLGNALGRSGRQIGSIMEKADAQLTPDLAQRLAQLSTEVADLGPEGQVVANKISKLIDSTTNGKGLSGQALRKFDTSLGRIAGGSTNGDVRYAAGGLQEIVRDAASQSLSKEDNVALQLARQQNFNVRQVADAAKGNDFLSPSQLLTQVNNYQKAARYGGGNDLAELAQWAKPTLGDKIPNSGTAQRALYQRILTNPVTSLGAVGGASYGANELGMNPVDVGVGGLLAYILSRGMAGKPASEFTRRLLTEAGGLGGLAVAPK